MWDLKVHLHSDTFHPTKPHPLIVPLSLGGIFSNHCSYVCGLTHATISLGRPTDNFMESVLPPLRGFWGLNSGHQICWPSTFIHQVILPAPWSYFLWFLIQRGYRFPQRKAYRLLVVTSVNWITSLPVPWFMGSEVTQITVAPNARQSWGCFYRKSDFYFITHYMYSKQQ